MALGLPDYRLGPLRGHPRHSQRDAEKEHDFARVGSPWRFVDGRRTIDAARPPAAGPGRTRCLLDYRQLKQAASQIFPVISFVALRGLHGPLDHPVHLGITSK
jgi:hypothetical protein